ncbi:hypothetical protein SAMN05444008_13013 [Cnuella takakiae]|uniref:Uncharacterized protein n=1 Tax=Cnuella takakiae TaxID=1302690 RepID=A0A1M5JBY6_9BACT|nr:hypothetical protein [Cnuella takakiae]OLY95614.1 hypothetical protein BUE76_00500 [Cnuella takakiae]SHG37885.1 hypothetical protein SAMN05444008_13013 [Cnuella takakiae]
MAGFNERIKQLIKEKDSEGFELEQQEKQEPDPELELLTPSPFYKVENIRSVPACLELRLPNGTSKAIPYSYILEINHKPSEGIEVISTNKRIRIYGRNLKQLYLLMVAFRIRCIEANIGNDLTEENKPFVKEIAIEDQ